MRTKGLWGQVLGFINTILPWRFRRTSTPAEANHAQFHAQFFAAIESSLDDFYIFEGIADTSGAITDFTFSYMNPNAERRLGVSRESLYGKILTEVRPFMVKSGLIHKFCEVVRTGVPYTCEVFIDDEMIKATWLNVQVVRIGNGLAVTSRDVTEHRRRTDRVNYLAHHDHLTGLANRTLFQERLRQAIARAKRHGHKVAVFLLDVDYFKQINDTVGHADGDLLLAAVGQRLYSSVRESDTVARMGGDEFVVVMPDFLTVEDVERSGREIIRRVSQPVEVGGRKVSLTVSVGIAIYPEGGSTDEELLRNSDTAMYSVKNSGRNGLCVFDESLQAGTALGQKMETDGGSAGDRIVTYDANGKRGPQDSEGDRATAIKSE